MASTLAARSFLGGEFAGGESAWWRGNWIPFDQGFACTRISHGSIKVIKQTTSSSVTNERRH